MPLNDLLQPFEGNVYRHIPVTSAMTVNDFRYAGQGRDNRWNHPGQRTLYLAHDHAAALAEWARHIELFYNPATDLPLQRRLYRLSVALPAVLDLRDPRVWKALGGVISEPAGFLEISRCRAIADYVRALTDAVAIHVPSIAFIDDFHRGNLVVFLDKLPDTQSFVRNIVDCGIVGFHPPAVPTKPSEPG